MITFAPLVRLCIGIVALGDELGCRAIVLFIFTKNDFSDAGVMKTVVAIRQYAQKLGFSQQWTTNFVYKVVMLAKKEPKPKE